MARARNIKPGFYKNEDLAECSIWARFIFPGLWMLADREGRLEDRPKRIKGELLPFDSEDVEPLLQELTRFKFISRYEIDGLKVIQILKFRDHQSPHFSEKPSDLPTEFPESPPLEENKFPESPPLEENKFPESPPLEAGSKRKNSESHHVLKRGSQPPDSLNPDSLNPESLSTPPPGGEAAKPPMTKRGAHLSPDFYPNETGIAYAETKRVAIAVELESFRNWHTAKGTTMKDWQAAWRTWCDKAVEFGRANGARASPNRPETLHDKRARAMEELTGRRSSGNERTERDITGECSAIPGEAIRVAG